ncbi:MAG: single-stranded DNA-binding protein [Clostridia bacterium]
MNKAFLIGNLTRDPEMRTTSSGVTMCSFGLAVNRRRKVEGQPDVDFFRITAFRQLADLCAKYLQKGRKISVVGTIQISTYDAQDGSKRTSVDIVADDVEFLPNAQQQAGGEYHPPVPPTAPKNFSPTEAGFTQVDEDELPF